MCRLPGGQRRVGESLFACARRELREETGFEIDLDHLYPEFVYTPGDRGTPGWHQTAVFHCHEEALSKKALPESKVLDMYWEPVHRLLNDESGMIRGVPVRESHLEYLWFLLGGKEIKGSDLCHRSRGVNVACHQH